MHPSPVLTSPILTRREPIPEPTLLSLANETLALVAGGLYSTSAHLSSFMLVCRRAALAAEHVRYSALTISGNQGRRLLTTLLSGTITTHRYRSMVHRVWYRGWADTDMHLNASLLSELLPLLSNVMALWLDANPLDTMYLMERLRKHGLVRERLHPAFVLSDMSTSSPYSPWTMHNLQHVRLTGDPVMAGIAFNRRLVSLDLSHVLDHDEFANFITGAEDSLLGLKTLSIKLEKTITILPAFPLISDTFPNLRNLSLEQKSLVVKDVLQYLATPNELFGNLQTLALNRIYSYRIPRWGAVFPYTGLTRAQMEVEVAQVAVHHKTVSCIGVGCDVFEMGRGCEFERRTLRYPEIDYWSSIFGRELELVRFVGTPLHIIPQPVGPDWVSI
ncbi:hypothetical protein DFP72DRAFT_1066939 [Ephemerocybe angulata]|uniref:F-box domain-containing protein n=1 Tax=Ephemerocybe angulata TaxID=980116 RepID=A0A8H6M571_9AGAR|nr:hypothetical protein DFP72DRAFT_1066939 [Tulosesus angulatus]